LILSAGTTKLGGIIAIRRGRPAVTALSCLLVFACFSGAAIPPRAGTGEHTANESATQPRGARQAVESRLSSENSEKLTAAIPPHQVTDGAVCPRPAAGSEVPEPTDLRSQNGTLEVDITYRNFLDHGEVRYCYSYRDGHEAPTLRVKPGDWLMLRLRNDLHQLPHTRVGTMPDMLPTSMAPAPCGGGAMDGLATNLHFHGLTVPSICHQDDAIDTLISPGTRPFEYRFQIPPDEPPGTYWYHPHVHGFSDPQVEGGASGALIVEGIERANKFLAGMPERVFVIRDEPLLNPDAQPAKQPAAQPPLLRDPEGDILNTGTGGGKPARDLSINFVPVAFPDYVPATIAVKPGEYELWHVVNAAAVTYLDLQIAQGGVPQAMGLVSLDGVPITKNGAIPNRTLWQGHMLVPPGGRISFVYRTPPVGTEATLITSAVDTGPAGENDPIRPLATIISGSDAPEPPSTLPAASSPFAVPKSAWLGDIKPVRERKLYFSEQPSDPKDPNSPTLFFITLDGEQPKIYDPHSPPDIIVHQGDIEDWTIENRSHELHAFHIHQIHFLLVGWNGAAVNDTFLRDTINTPYWDGKSAAYPSVKLRMDFRDPNSVGTFVYHCHLLEHEDGGMMGTIRVIATSGSSDAPE
jgi:FtsP/CotA-like multicopper oxidase with cupredoxin domain